MIQVLYFTSLVNLKKNKKQNFTEIKDHRHIGWEKTLHCTLIKLNKKKTPKC